MILVPGRLTELAASTERALVRHFDPVPRPWLRSTEDPDDCRWRAVVERDARVDGAFVYAVSTTGVFCRPSCGARTPLRKNVSFYRAPSEAKIGILAASVLAAIWGSVVLSRTLRRSTMSG